MVTPDGQDEWYNERWSCGQIGPYEHHAELCMFLEMNHVAETTIVCESFEYRKGLRDNVELISREYIGVVKLIAAQRNIPVVFQTAAVGKIRESKDGKAGSFVQKRHLERMGLWSPGTPHAMDAYGHLLYYATQRLRRNDLLVRGWK